jgi:hypothetical protein
MGSSNSMEMSRIVLSAADPWGLWMLLISDSLSVMFLVSGDKVLIEIGIGSGVM